MNLMINLVLTLCIVGVFAYIVTLIPMPDIFKKVIYAVICLGVVLYVAGIFGYGPGLLR